MSIIPNPSPQLAAFFAVIEHAQSGVSGGGFDEAFYDLLSDDFVFEKIPPPQAHAKAGKAEFRTVIDKTVKGYNHWTVGFHHRS